MNRALADLSAQETDLLPARLTLGGFFPGWGDMTNVFANNFAVGSAQPDWDGLGDWDTGSAASAVAVQRINVVGPVR
ncbi:hypothetical protein [Amycolatopsis taiwanensis]|uniref:Uncharacterized protein n=1 Tax=Amycolatopsis taiwanensis TaxID=342230 RepID=A0A9W6VGW8_9PSEU|nr:hypothetical protein [Amycolatopsis taiwanensis]GLY65931.1 hypothetical protein Atai01_25500 [Amycolatopsis taiwanensis]